MLQEYQVPFARNWNDWLCGGPKPNGWTREGDPVKFDFEPVLCDMQVGEVAVEDVLAKNRKEVEKWHLAFLKGYSDYEKTAYWNEYLLPRMTREKALIKAERFLRLDRTFDIAKAPPIWVADVSSFLDFRYFRFDGCHRSCCALLKGAKTLPALIFSVKQNAIVL